MSMNHKILETLEYGRVKGQLAQFIVSATGRAELAKLEPQTDYTTIHHWVEETEDGADLLRLVGGIPLPELADVSPQLKRLKVQASLNGTELAQITQVLRTSMAVQNFFEGLVEKKIRLRTIDNLATSLVTIPEVTRRLARSLDPDGRVTDEASTKLHGVRQLITQTEVDIRHELERYTRGKQAKKLSDPIITIRNDRYVIPVLAQYRNQFGGVVHDQSASGQTLYIEPGSVVELNNRLRQAQIEERQEVRKVLAELSDLVRPYRNDIAQNAQLLGHLDLINAKAKLAAAMKASVPLLNQEGEVNLRMARHPLIDQEKVVANDIALGKDYQAIVITGPNTGGKTITLKTLGLIQLMAQSGMFIPANENSTVAIFDNVFADIGDEQSLEQNLSTFSGHMENVKRILEQITANSLVLLDELGAGTDPKEGAALAMAILDQIGATGSEVVVTTHYPELKVYGYDRAKTINASMEFDQQTLQPTYRLLLGVPGQSNGIAIAKRLGIEHHLRQLEIQGATVKENELIDAQGALNALHKDNPRLNHNSVLQRAKQKHQLKVGDHVNVKSYGQQGVLLNKRGAHKWEVQLGILKMAIDEADLEKISAKQAKQAEKKHAQPRRMAVRTIQTRQTSARLDLRGHRYEEAMSELASFIDHALLNNLPSVTIIHGKGTGALRKGTQQYLQSNPRVKNFEYASPSNGGDGATIAYF